HTALEMSGGCCCGVLTGKEIGKQNNYPFQESVHFCPAEATTFKSTSELSCSWSSSDVIIQMKIKHLVNHIQGDRSTEDVVSGNKLQFIDWEINSDEEDASECYESEDDRVLWIVKEKMAHRMSCSLIQVHRTNRILNQMEDSLWKTDKSEITLYTPRNTKFPKAQENSTKKKLLRGELAEGMNELKNQERSDTAMLCVRPHHNGDKQYRQAQRSKTIIPSPSSPEGLSPRCSRTLRDRRNLPDDDFNTHCSFYARVIYQRPPSFPN
ncbi:hypothetical protein J0S82_008623, partial [Galemys pyrenaicus]